MRSVYPGMILAMIMSPISVNAGELCQKEFGRLTYKLENFSGGAEDKKELLSEYHSRRQSLSALCSPKQIARIESAADKVFGGNKTSRSITALEYERRQTVDIGVVEDYAIYKKK